MKKTLSEINATIAELAEYTRLQEELTAQIDSLKDQIKDYMTTEGIDEMLGEQGEHIIWKDVISNRFDTTSFKKSWLELYNSYTKPSKTRPFKFFA